MNAGFSKFKKRLRTESLIKGAALAIALALPIPAVLLLLWKLAGVDLGALTALWYLLGTLPGFAGGGIYLVLRFPTECRLAARLDSELDFGDRAKTMLAYRNDDGVMAALQREDTERRLAAVPANAIPIRKIISFALVLCLSVCFMCVSLFVPVLANDRDPGISETPLDPENKELLILALRELAGQVESSMVQDNLKKSTVGHLNSLIEVVEENDLISIMKQKAVDVVLAVGADLNAVNSSIPISEALAASELEPIAQLGKAIGEVSGASAKKGLRALESAISECAATEPERAVLLISELNACLRNSEVGYEDLLRTALSRLYVGLSEASEKNYSGMSDAIDTASGEIAEILLTQRDNKTTVTRVLERLRSLFSITDADLAAPEDSEDPKPPATGEGDKPEDGEFDDQTQEGGLGGGDTILGGDNMIYWPKEDKYVSYAEAFFEYYAIAEALVEKGELDPDVLEAIKEYFSALGGAVDFRK